MKFELSIHAKKEVVDHPVDFCTLGIDFPIEKRFYECGGSCGDQLKRLEFKKRITIKKVYEAFYGYVHPVP